MNKKKVIGVFFGTALLLLGLLWFLQGSDLVHVKPILCFANCQPIAGKSLAWKIAGAVVSIAGASIIYKSLKKKRNG